MNPYQQPMPYPYAHPTYRHKYHINPAESKIIYQNPHNMPQYPIPNHMNQMKIPQNMPTYYVNPPPQFNSGQYPPQAHFIQNEQVRARSLSPMNVSPQVINQNPRGMSPNSHNLPYYYGAPQHQYMNSGQQYWNQGVQQQGLQQENQAQSSNQNSIPVMLNNPDISKLVSPSAQTKVTTNSIGTSVINFQYQGQLGAGKKIVQSIQTHTHDKESQSPNQMLNSLASALKSNMGVSRQQPINQSAININLTSVASKRIEDSGINIVLNSAKTDSLAPNMIIDASRYATVGSSQPKSQPMFNITNSYVPPNRQVQEIHSSIKFPQITQLQALLSQTQVPENVPTQIQQTSENYTENAEQISSNPIWEQRFIMIYQKFEWFYERYDFITREFQCLSQEFQNVNSEDEWLELKERHDLLLEKIQQIQEELYNTIHENQQLADQYELQNRNSKQSDEVQRVWQHRYHELLEQYKSLSQNYADLQSQGNNQNISQSQHSQNKGGMSLDEQSEMQSKFHQLQNQYNVLCEEYEKIRVEYERIYEENTLYSKENNDLMMGQEQARNMASQLQAYVEELQQQNDQLTKQQRKSSPSQQNYVPRQEFDKMQYHFGEEIQKYEEELQKYRMALQQYEQKTDQNRQQLQKISEIAMERENRIRQLQIYQNSNSKSGHSNNNISQNQNQDLERRYVSILEQDVKLWREKQTDFLHKIELKDMERRSLEEKNYYLEKELEAKKIQMDRMQKYLNEKHSKIEQNTNGHIQEASRHVIEQEVARPMGSTHYEEQIHDLQSQLHEIQNVFNTKISTYRELEQSILNYETQLRQQSNAQSMNEIEFQKRISEIEIDFSRKIAQKDMRITVLNSEVQRLKESYYTATKQKQSLKDSLKAELIENEKLLNQRHNTRVAEMEKKIEEKSSEITYYKQFLQKYEREAKSKNDELMELRIFVSQMKKTASSTNISPARNDYQLIKEELKLKQEMLERKNQELSKIKREKEYKVKHISELQHELEEVNSELTKRRTEVSSLKRQINDLQALESEYEGLKSTLSKKSLEINQLKQELFEIQKLKMENESQKRDLERFVHQNKDKYKEIQKLKEENYELERKIAFSKTSHLNANNLASQSRYQGAQDESEVSELRELIRKKDMQISRISQSLQEGQYFLENKSRQLQMQKSQLSAMTKSKQSQVSSLTYNVSTLESRLKDSETKRVKLNEQTNELRAKFEEQLKSESQRQKAYYDKVIARHEDDYKGLKEKLRAAEEGWNKMEIELEKSKTTEKNLQIELSEMGKKVSVYQSQTLQKEEIFLSFRQKHAQTQNSTKALYEQISALKLQLQTKQQQMKLSEQKNQILQQKIKKSKKDFQTFRTKLIVSQQHQNNNSVVQYLSKRIADYESKMMNQSEKDFGFKVKDQEANHVFENQIVYHLKMENDMLRKELEGKGIQYDRKVLNQLEEENLKRSKNLLRNSAFSSKLGNISSNLLIKDNIEDVNFYKQKNKQLQQRVEKHLKYNKELKQKIELLIKSSSDSKEINYFKEQIAEYENKVAQLEKKIQSLTEENKNINKGMSKRQSRVEEHYEDRVKELENRLAQMGKNLEQLSQQKSDLEIARSQLQMQKVTLNEEVKRLNEKIATLQSSKNQKYEQQVVELREKCENYESQISKISNRARILEQEIKRLNEMNNVSKLSINELNGLKQKIQELSNALSKGERQLQEEQARGNSLANEVASLQLKCRTWESETERLKEMNELYAKKQRNDLSESAVMKQSTSGLQSQLSTLQTQISTLASERQELESLISSLMQQLKYYESLLPSLTYDLQFIRSDTLLEETLVEEMVMGGDNTAECIDGLRVNVQRKMYWIEQMFNKVRKL